MPELNVVLRTDSTAFSPTPPAFLYEVIVASDPNGYYTIPAHTTGYIEFTTYENGILQTRYATLTAQDFDLVITSQGYSLGFFYSDYPVIADSAFIYNSTHDTV